MDRTVFMPLPSVESFEAAKLMVVSLLDTSPYSLAGLAMIQRLGQDSWSLSLVTDKYPYAPGHCSQVLTEIRELFKDVVNIKMQDPCVMYSAHPITHASMWRFQIRIVVSTPEPQEVEEKPVAVATYVDPFPKKLVRRYERTPTPSDDGMSEDPLMRLTSQYQPPPQEEVFHDDASRFCAFSDDGSEYTVSDGELPPLNRSVSKHSIISNKSKGSESQKSDYFTLENVLSFDKDEIVKKYKTTNSKKLNVYFSLRRKALKAQRTPLDSLTRIMKKILVRGLECTLTGEFSSWKRQSVRDVEPDSTAATAYVYTRMSDKIKTDLGVLNSLSILSRCKGTDQNKKMIEFNAYRRYLAQNYLLQRGINLHTELGVADAKKLLSKLAQHNKMDLRYLLSLRGYDKLIGFDPKKIGSVEPKMSHLFCTHG